MSFDFMQFTLEIFLGHFQDLGIVQFSRCGQSAFPRIEQHDSLCQNIDIKIPAFGKCIVEFGDAFIDDLRASLSIRIFVLQEMRFDTTRYGYRSSPESFFRHDQNIVVAHELDFTASVIPLYIQFDISISGIAAVKDNHYDILYFIADQADQFPQISLFAFGQKVYRGLHIHKIMKIFPKTHTRLMLI